MSRSAASALPELSAGELSVTHSRVEVRPVAFLSFALGAAPSNTTTAFPDPSWPVTTRRVGRVMPGQAESGRKPKSEPCGWALSETPQWSVRFAGQVQSSGLPTLYDELTRCTSAVYSMAAPKGATK